MFIKKKAQAFQEFVILLAIVASAFIAMQIYMKRGIQGRLRDLANQISSKQYESNETTSNTTITRTGSSTETEKTGTFKVVGSENVTTEYEQTTVAQ